ncbi:hypothetical protein Ga0074812_123101 [Parafrankia irregularis]|uniref:Uncharacterized protein n=1 Tax=Parafrankia irregularis TaxID=795642 RepID=A0A0S4QVR6_9ACTN|nr:hypothetical protein Ga0074812_123101 [Parafrankia irregularis]
MSRSQAKSVACTSLTWTVRARPEPVTAAEPSKSCQVSVGAPGRSAR